MKLNNSETNMITHLDAGYTGLLVRTFEESRILDVLIAYCANVTNGVEGPQLWTYSFCTGLQIRYNPGHDNPSNVPCQPQELLAKVAQFPEDQDLYLVLLDMHSAVDTPVITRSVRELMTLFRGQPSERGLIFVSPDMQIPADLQKEIAIIEHDLPDLAELTEVADSVVSDFNEHHAENPAEVTEEAVHAALGLTRNEARQAFSRSLVECQSIQVARVHAEKKQAIKRTGALEYIDTQLSFQDIGGLENLKTWLGKRRKAFSPRAKEAGIPTPRGLLTVGLPGCGKSVVCKAAGAAWGYPLIRMDVGSLMQGVVGGSEASMRQAIKTVEAVAPCILWIDELEKAFSGTKSSGQTDGGTMSRMFGTFLTWMQEKTAEVFVIATANNVSTLPPELLRKGRFDEIMMVDLPHDVEREEIITINIKKHRRAPATFDMAKLVSASKGFSGAEIEESINEAVLEAFVANTGLNTDLVLGAMKETTPLSATAKGQVDELRAWAKERRVRPASDDGKPKAKSRSKPKAEPEAEPEAEVKPKRVRNRAKAAS